MTPIRYRYTYPREPLPDSRVEAIIREGEPKCWKPHIVRLGQIGDRGIKRPEFTELRCEMEEGLLAYFRVQGFGIGKEFSPVPISEHPSRQAVAFAASSTVGVHLYPISAIRTLDKLGGRGSLTAMVDGDPFLIVDMRDKRQTKAERNDREPTALAEAYLFDYLVGGGQRIESSYLVDRPSSGPDGNRLPRRIRSQYQQESFSYSEDRRLQVAFSNTDQRISQAFWDVLDEAAKHRLKLGRLRNILADVLLPEARARFFTTYGQILESRMLGEVRIYVR